MRRIVFSLVALACTLGAALAIATTSPKDGGPLPRAYLDRVAADKTAFQMQGAWVKKARRIKEARDAYLAELVITQGPQALSAPLPEQYVVSGTIEVPVFCGYFQSQAAPYAIGSLQGQLFDDPSGTVTDFWDEVSYGNLNLTGTVYGWTQTANIDAYYEGGIGCNGLCGTAKVGEFIKELLDANDGSVDFGIYDNDGPDGVPNSGDDDGVVDFAAFVHNEAGGECGNTNIWSHRWVYRGWPVSNSNMYQTNDPRTGGGFIYIDDYVIQPAKNCDNATIIDIGVFCHEFGHALGLPDLYDTDSCGGSCPGDNGIGHWGIMGSGNWNTPSSPAHTCAWTREQLGWVIPTVADWTDAFVSVGNINDNPIAYKLPFTNDRFRRSNACAINGAYSLYCGLTQAEGTARNYASPGPGGGYGSNWRETVERDFTYSGSGTVTMAYDYAYDLEAGFDYAYTIIEVNGTESILATYDGVNSGFTNHNITPYLGPLAGVGGTYTLKFRVVTDISFDDDDGNNATTCGALAVDDVSVTGGGENYNTNFETYVDGWHQDPAENVATEYWLVENRRATGFDSNLHQPGFLIMHVDNGVMMNPFLGNSAGDSNDQTRGLVIEEANGDWDLNTGGGSNRGEPTDPFPGTSSKTSFTSATNPGSNDNTGRTTRIQVTNISAAGPSMTANMRAGDPPPQLTSISPNVIDNNVPAQSIAVTGNLIRHGATFGFTNPTASSSPRTQGAASDVIAADVEWVDPVRLIGTINAYGIEPGTWDLVVTNPDGQTATLSNALTVNFVIVATQLQSASVRAVEGAVELRYELFDQEDDEYVRLYRSTRSNAGYTIIEGDLHDNGRGVYTYTDTDVEPGGTYYYRLASYQNGEERELHRASATVPRSAFTLSQNIPNPFNPTTSITFSLPQRSNVMLNIYDVSGSLVRTLADGQFGPGPHNLQWNGRDNAGNPVSSGVYLYRLTAGKQSLTRKMVLLK